MKHTLIFFLVFLGVAGWFFWYQAQTPCDRTFRYSVGDVDIGFGMTTSEIIKTLREVETMWEEPTGLDLFEYDPQSDFKIHLVYDERQARTDESKVVGENMNQLEDSFQDTQIQHQNLKKQYDERTAVFQKKLDLYNTRMNALNADIQMWNTKGGAPEQEYNRIENEKKSLGVEFDSIQKQENELNVLREQLNMLADEGNQARDQYNEKVFEYNDIYGGEGEFSQGTWFFDRIEIYEFEDKKHLKLVLAHELGHALGLDHVEDPQAIMYYLMENQELSDRRVTDADIAALNDLCLSSGVLE